MWVPHSNQREWLIRGMALKVAHLMYLSDEQNTRQVMASAITLYAG